MKKRMVIMLICLGVLFGSIILFKSVIGLIIKQKIAANKSPIIEVTAIKAEPSEWQQKITVSGSLRAINGVNVTTEMAGMVQAIYFTPGAKVKQGTVLVQLNADTEKGQLQSLQAQAALAKITLDRDKAQYAIQAVSKQTVDSDEQNLKSLQGQIAEQTATVKKKTIVAPFDGRLGINLVNVGQYISPGDTIVSLQSLDPIYADFYVPQQFLARIKTGQAVIATTDTYPDEHYKGRVTTINPAVDQNSRNVQVEATIPNTDPQHELIPGMFATVEVITGKPIQYLTLPQTSISYNPYGDIVYIITNKGQDEKGDILIVEPNFVTLGDTRGDQVAVLSGVKEGDVVVTSGQLKLKKDSRVVINNNIQPLNNPIPIARNEH